MTRNQIAYWTLKETARYNRAIESLRGGELAHAIEIDTRKAIENERHNRVSEAQSEKSLGIASFNAEVNRLNASTNAYNAETSRLNASTNAYNAETSRFQTNENRRANMHAEELRSEELGTRQGELAVRQQYLSSQIDVATSEIEKAAKSMEKMQAEIDKIQTETGYLDDANRRAWMESVTKSLNNAAQAMRALGSIDEN